MEILREILKKNWCFLFASSSPWMPYNCCAKVSKSAVPISSARCVMGIRIKILKDSLWNVIWWKRWILMSPSKCIIYYLHYYKYHNNWSYKQSTISGVALFWLQNLKSFKQTCSVMVSKQCCFRHCRFLMGKCLRSRKQCIAHAKGRKTMQPPMKSSADEWLWA